MAGIWTSSWPRGEKGSDSTRAQCVKLTYIFGCPKSQLGSNRPLNIRTSQGNSPMFDRPLDPERNAWHHCHWWSHLPAKWCWDPIAKAASKGYEMYPPHPGVNHLPFVSRFPKRNSGTPGMSWVAYMWGEIANLRISLPRHPYYNWVFAMWSVGESYWVLDGRWFWCLGHVSWHFLVGANYSTWKQHGGRRAEQETNHIKNTN